MTNRRSFFKSLALLGAAAAGCPGVFVPKFEPVKWKRTPSLGRELYVPNPEYYTAQYEIYYITQPGLFDGRILVDRAGKPNIEPYPVRFNTSPYHPIPPFIKYSDVYA